MSITSLSFSISRIMKSTGKINLSTFTKMSSQMPRGCLINLSANYSETIVVFAFPKPNFLKRDKSIKLILAPKSHNALSINKLPILQGIVKLPGSFNFSGYLYWRIALHSSVSMTVSLSSSFLLFDIISFINLT